MEFVSEHYIWFIVGGVFLLMTVIGYIADKSDFVNKQKAKDKDKEKELQKEKERIIKEKLEEQQDLDRKKEEPMEVVYEESSELAAPEITEEEIVNEPINEDMTSEEHIDSEPLNDTVEFMTPNTETNEPISDTNYGNPLTDGVLDLDSYAQSKEEPIEEIKQVEETVEQVDLSKTQPIPELDALTDEVSEDDVWKF
jgi:hypothetical protein